MHAMDMLKSHPEVRGSTNGILVRCIEECLDCAVICTSCADACLAERSDMELRQCIRLDLDCADLCHATGALASRRTGSNEAVLRGTLELCAEACRECAEECRRHAKMHEHCRICADSCQRCERICIEAARTITVTRQ